MIKTHGMTSLIITMILMISAILIMLFSAGHTVLQQKSSTNLYASQQAFQAAESGIEYAIAFLQIKANVTTVLSSPSGGFINYNFPATTQSDGTIYNVNVTNPQANNYNVLTLTSTGTNADGTSTEVITQQVYSTVSVKNAVTTQGSVNAGGGSSITGIVDAGQTVTVGNNATITTIIQNDTSLTSLTGDELFMSIFGMTKAAMKASVTYYPNSSFSPSTLSGQNWVDTNFKITSNTTLGSTSNPLLLIVNGDLSISGSTIINGLVYVIGSIKVTGGLNFNGAIIAEGNINTSGTSTFNESVVKLFTPVAYSKIPGSWRDF